MKTKHYVWTAAFLAVVLAAACASVEYEAPQESQAQVSEVVEIVEEVSSGGEPRVIEMTATNWQFEPREVRVKAGERVILKVVSTDVAHGIQIPEFGVNEYLRPNAEVEIELQPDLPGEYEFLCSVECGRGHNSMRGVLIVE